MLQTEFLGANIGFFSIFAELEFESRDALKIIAIEPLQKNFHLLKENMKKYCPTAHLIQAAVTTPHRERKKNENMKSMNNNKVKNKKSRTAQDEDSSHTISMTYFPRMPGNSCLSHYSDQKLKERKQYKSENNYLLGMKEEICISRTLSSIINEFNDCCRRISLLKIDVEGSELEVLESINDSHWELIDQIVLETARPEKLFSLEALSSSTSTSKATIPSTFAATATFPSTLTLASSPHNIDRIQSPRLYIEEKSPNIDIMMSPVKNIDIIEDETAVIEKYSTSDEKKEICILGHICELLQMKGFKVHVDSDHDLGCDTVVLVYATRKY